MVRQMHWHRTLEPAFEYETGLSKFGRVRSLRCSSLLSRMSEYEYEWVDTFIFLYE